MNIKHIKRKMIALLCSLFILLPLSAFAATKANLLTVPKNDKNAQLLFVLLAKKSEIHAIKGKRNTYKMVLKNVNPSVIYFTNRPQRYTNKIPVATFIMEWGNGSFKEVPPNAVIEAVRLNQNFHKEHARSVSYVVELTHPSYQKEKDILTFDIQPLPGRNNSIPKFTDSDYVAVFIDNALMCPSCDG